MRAWNMISFFLFFFLLFLVPRTEVTMVYCLRRTATMMACSILTLECAHAFALAPPSVYACPSATIARSSQAMPKGLVYQPTFGRLVPFTTLASTHTSHKIIHASFLLQALSALHLSYRKHFLPSHTQHLGMEYKEGCATAPVHNLHILYIILIVYYSRGLQSTFTIS